MYTQASDRPGLRSSAAGRAGMTKLLERMFGPRSLTAAASSIVDEARQATAATLRETAAVSANFTAPYPGDDALLGSQRRCAEMAQHLLRTATTLPSASGPFRVVLMGRTQAGKSTLFNYLTGGEHSLVGRGGQGTTKHVVPAPLASCPDILVVDTPGVGALDRPEDRVTAVAEARTADLVVWVAANNSLQEETAAALEQLADWGVPLVIVWNCRAALDTPENRADFLRYPEDTFKDLGGHQSRARGFLEPFGQRPRAEFALHAGAALASLTATTEADILHRASQAEQLIRFLEAEARRRVQYRAIAVVDVARRALVDAERAAGALAIDLRSTEDTRLRAAEDLAKRTQALLNGVDLRLKAGLDAPLDQLRPWVDEHYQLEDEELQPLWDQAEQSVRAEIAQHFTETAEHLNRELTRAADDVMGGWSARFDNLQALHRPLAPGLGNPQWLDTAIRVAVRSAGAVAVLVATRRFGPDAGQQVSTAVDSIVGSVIGFLGRRSGRLARRRHTLHRWVSETREAIRREAVDDWNGDVASVRTALAERRAADAASAGSARDAAEFARRLAEQAGQSVSDIDSILVRALLRLEGCDRAAERAGPVFRWPGLAAAVLVDDQQALDELLLWPMQASPESIRPVPGGSNVAPAERAAHALDLGRRGGMIIPSPCGLEAVVDDGSSVALLQAEAPLVSAVAGIAVSLRPPSP